ncbi:MAG TPA: IPT/TIG domain-containing protein, partial [Candidatus Angelobacter sp.]|nr:IPT/TIG domain-containing protein [Candidatus Angelobacter sp.]
MDTVLSAKFRFTINVILLLGFLNLTLAWASPHISSISPTVGQVSPVGSPLTINGTGFGASASGNTVTIGGV